MEKQNACTLLVGTYSDSAATENRTAVPQKVTHRNTTEPGNFAPRCTHKGTGNEYLNKQVQRHVTAAPFTVAESWETTTGAHQQRNGQQGVVRPYNRILLSHDR